MLFFATRMSRLFTAMLRPSSKFCVIVTSNDPLTTGLNSGVRLFERFRESLNVRYAPVPVTHCRPTWTLIAWYVFVNADVWLAIVFDCGVLRCPICALNAM